MKKNNKVLVGLSGGVDSLVTAQYLIKKGMDVIGVTLYLFDDEFNNKPQFLNDAKLISKKLGIKHYIFDIRREFKEKIIDKFVEEYKNARTPNPCVYCNREIKFEKFFEIADELGAYYIATGHYVKKFYNKKTKEYEIFRSNNKRKDQSYVMFSLTQEKLNRVLFELGEIKDKKETREKAIEICKETSTKKDSMGICFVQNQNFYDFIKKNTDVKEGNFILEDGKILGKHTGIYKYTIGQKRDLIFKGKNDYTVIDIKADTNEVVLGADTNCYFNGFFINQINFISKKEIYENKILTLRVCQWGEDLFAKIYKISNDLIKVKFKEPQRAISKGQACVFFEEDRILGGGIILDVF